LQGGTESAMREGRAREGPDLVGRVSGSEEWV
jgi:hypothetical protein